MKESFEWKSDVVEYRLNESERDFSIEVPYKSVERLKRSGKRKKKRNLGGNLRVSSSRFFVFPSLPNFCSPSLSWNILDKKKKIDKSISTGDRKSSCRRFASSAINSFYFTLSTSSQLSRVWNLILIEFFSLFANINNFPLSLCYKE